MTNAQRNGENVEKYKLISFDMFQTLVDLNTQKDIVMRTVLGDHYSIDMGASLWNDANRFVFWHFQKTRNSAEEFVEVLKIFEQCYAELFPKYNVKMDPVIGARVLAEAHAKSLFYPDSLPFLEKVQQKYQTCLISDADLIMIEDLFTKVKFDRIYISEKYKVYKSDRSGALFKAAIDEFQIKPSEMLHIGDAYSDVLGAKQVGADAAWINRRGYEWQHEIRPDYIITSLLELSI